MKYISQCRRTVNFFTVSKRTYTIFSCSLSGNKTENQCQKVGIFYHNREFLESYSNVILETVEYKLYFQ